MALEKAIRLSEDKQHAAALEQAEAAVRADPACNLARYWQGIILVNLGEVDKALDIFTEIVEAGRSKEEGEASNIQVDTAINLGITLGKLGKTVESSYWLSQAVMMDLKDAHQLQWKAYRNMAVNSIQAGDAISATLQALKARELAPTRVDENTIRDLARAIKGEQTCINVLYFHKDPVQVQHPVRTAPVTVARDADLEAKLEQGFRVSAMAPVPGRNLLFIFYRDQLIADVVDTVTGLVTKLKIGSPVRAAAANWGGLYLGSASAPTLEAFSLAGKPVRTYEIPASATSVAVCPRTRQAFVAASGVIHGLDLDTGKVQATDLVGQVVCLDTARRLVYATYNPGPRSNSGAIIVNGRPVFFSSMGDVFKDQNVILKGAYKRGGFSAVAAIRMDAASNGCTMDVSRDGRWITVTGGGGYRGPGGRQGYGTGVLSTDDMAQMERFYGSEAYSQTAMFNPVADQLALVATGQIKFFNLGSDREGFSDKGEFSSVGRWSPEGAWFFVGGKDKGVRAYRNTLTPADEQAFLAIQKAVQVEAAAPVVATGPDAGGGPGPSVRTAESRQIPALLQFVPAGTLEQAKLRAAAGARSATQGKPPLWIDLPLYTRDSALSTKVRTLLNGFTPDDAGLAVYQLKGILRDSPGYVPATYALGVAQYANNNVAEAIRLLLDVVHSDAGQSTLTSEALCALGAAYTKSGREAEALDCLATGLLVDRDHPATVRLIAPLMQKHGIAYRRPEPAVPDGTPEPVAGPLGLSSVPPLNWPAHRKTDKPISGEVLFGVMAQRTASIKTDTGYGSGVFITDDGCLLTNEHVVHGPSSSIDVTLFVVQDGKVANAGVRPARVLYADPENDVAVLKVSNPPPGQKSLSLAKEDPPTGMKVFAIGSPSLGERVLEQSLTEGIISSNQRVLDGRRWLQHSAGINPGNSGGPLVSQYGEIVGLVTLKAKMENVGFAIPAPRLRELLHQPATP